MTPDANKPKKPRDLDAFMKRARDRFALAVEADADIRKESLQDLKFVSNDQWDDAVRIQRELQKRPCLTVNRLAQPVQQVTNEQRQNRPAIKISPVDSGADEETADILQGLTRHIENNSGADSAYDMAFKYAASGGFGYFRVLTEYVDEKSFDQEILIKRVLDPFSVYVDPAAKEPDYSDAQWAFVTEDLTREQFKEQFPDAQMTSADFFDGNANDSADWLTEDGIRIAEYWYIESTDKTLCHLADGSTAFADELPEGAQIVKKRKTSVPVVKWCKINGAEILEETDWAGKYIPIVPVLGEEMVIEGKRKVISMVRNSIDSQRMYNYFKSAQAEAIALAPKAPYILAEGQARGHEKQWRDANQTADAYLEYVPVATGGVMAPPPQRTAFEAPIQSINFAAAGASDDVKSTTGIFDPSLGENNSNEKSGRAIQALQQQGGTANFHLIDNLSRAIRHLGRILIDLIPHIYDAPRVVRIIGEHGDQRMVTINQETMEQGVAKIYDVTTGRYDVTVSVGPSSQTKRIEAAAGMAGFAQAAPELLVRFADLFVKAQDWPMANEIAERLVPPDIAAKDGQQQPIPPQVQQQLSQMGQMNQALIQRVHELTDTIQSKKLELDSRERVAAMNAQVQLIATEATINAKNAQSLLAGELQSIKHRLDMQQESDLQGQDQAYDVGLTAMQQGHAADQSAQDRSHQADQQQAAQQHQSDQQASAQDAQASQQQSAQDAAAEQAAALPKAA